jgi:hypothetical protein
MLYRSYNEVLDRLNKNKPAIRILNDFIECLEGSPVMFCKQINTTIDFYLMIAKEAIYLGDQK